jgi:hypothetical protein
MMPCQPWWPTNASAGTVTANPTGTTTSRTNSCAQHALGVALRVTTLGIVVIEVRGELVAQGAGVDRGDPGHASAVKRPSAAEDTGCGAAAIASHTCT